MLTSVQTWNLGFRIGIYTLAMVLLGLLVAVVFYYAFGGAALSGEFFLPWLVCFGAGLASLLVVEPFRHPSGSPYGFLLGGAIRTTPPLVLVVILLVKQQPVEFLFWVNLLISYFFMLIVVLSLILPNQTTGKEDPIKKLPEKIQKNNGPSTTDKS